MASPEDERASGDTQAVSSETTRELKSRRAGYLDSLTTLHSATAPGGVKIRAYELDDGDRPSNGMAVMLTIDAGPDASRTWKLPLDVRSVTKLSVALPGVLLLEGMRDVSDVHGRSEAYGFRAELRYGLRDGALADNLAFELDGELRVLAEEQRDVVATLASVRALTTASSSELRASAAICGAPRGTRLMLLLQGRHDAATFDLGVDVGAVSKVTFPRRGEIRIEGDGESYRVTFSAADDSAPDVVTLAKVR